MKKRDVQVFTIADGTTVLRSRTWERLKFEIEYGLQRGTTANSYVIEGSKQAIIDLPGESFADDFLDAFRARFDPRQINYVVLSHINLNRFTTLKAFLEIAPQAIIVASNPGAINLRNILNEQQSQLEPEIFIVKGDESLYLGKGHHLEFIPTPLPRWPDELCSYDPKTEILFTDKIFSTHVCGEQILDEGWNVYSEDKRYYFDCLMAPQAQQLEIALDRLTTKPAKMYATGHGPLVKHGIQDVTNNYKNWIKSQKKQELTVAVIYASAYGNTTVLGQAIARGITKSGVRVEFINAEIADPDYIKDVINKCSGFIFGTPTLGGHAPTPIQTALGITLANSDRSKIVGVFGSYGWSGEAIDLIESKLTDAGFRFGFRTIRVKFKPDETTLKTCEEAGTDFAQSLKKIQRSRKPKSSFSQSQAARTEQALGRIIGSLSVVTCRQGEVRGAMVASWISQATFNPPGLTIAVAKERAIETLLHQGNFFAVNVLAEGQQQALIKHFLKPFSPGENRFTGINIEESEQGVPILSEALAYIECQVEQKMECGDHWLIYGVAKKGKVMRDGITAIHHRKSGSYY